MTIGRNNSQSQYSWSNEHEHKYPCAIMLWIGAADSKHDAAANGILDTFAKGAMAY